MFTNTSNIIPNPYFFFLSHLKSDVFSIFRKYIIFKVENKKKVQSKNLIFHQRNKITKPLFLDPSDEERMIQIITEGDLVRGNK